VIGCHRIRHETWREDSRQAYRSLYGRADFDPTSRKPLIDFDETWILELPPKTTPCKIWFRSDDVGGLSKYPVSHCKVCLSFFLWSLRPPPLVTCTGRTSGPILTIYTSYDVFPRKDVSFGGLVDITPYLWVQRPKNSKRWAWIGIFKPNS